MQGQKIRSVLSRHLPFLQHTLFWGIAALCLLTGLRADLALLLGIFLALGIGTPYPKQTGKVMKHLLAISIIGLGAGMNLTDIAQAGMSGLGYTFVSIAFVLICGQILGHLFKTDRVLSLLISVGTAICGGSAIAAVAPVLKAKDHQISIALGVVFVLNALALFLFPWIGHIVDMPQELFGLWSALAIHDTSSVVGAGLQYGPEALEVGTTVKLVRALWIIPVVFLVYAFYVRGESGSNDPESKFEEKSPRIKYPWFILGFVLMAALATWLPVFAPAAEMIAFSAKRLLVVVLFLIGTSLSLEALRSSGFAPLLQGVCLWILVSISSFFMIYSGVMTP